MKLKITVVLLLVFLLLIVSCKVQTNDESVLKIKPFELVEEETEEQIAEEAKEPVKETTTEEPEPINTAPKLECTDTEECDSNEQCIEGVCSTIEELYDTDCSNKCNFDSVVVETSDGETYTFNRGRGAYTFAGALNWKLLTGPDYCPGDKVIVPIEIEKVSYGEVLNTQTLVISPGETSEHIDHPTVNRIDFTLEVVSVNEEC